MLHNEARKLLIEAWNKTHNATEMAECFSVNPSTVYRLKKKNAGNRLCGNQNLPTWP